MDYTSHFIPQSDYEFGQPDESSCSKHDKGRLYFNKIKGLLSVYREVVKDGLHD